jgi:hypothetical protein
LKLLTVAFPHLQDAFGDEELPIAFLLKRGADQARAAGRSRPVSTPRAVRRRRSTKTRAKR